MTLIKSISGIRGTLGGSIGENLTPPDIVSFVSAFGQMIKEDQLPRRIVIGRDGRISGRELEALVVSTLVMMGFEVINLGWSTTPTVEMAVTSKKASGGIIITASHNPKQWNALKFLNNSGEFISSEAGQKMLTIAANKSSDFANIDQFGSLHNDEDALTKHIEAILRLPSVKVDTIINRHFHIGVDCINSTGALAVPALLDRLGCTYFLINEKISGDFAHNPEPLETNLEELMNKVASTKCDLGIAVDPDVDRLAFVDETGTYCGEEYTLVMVADWILRNEPGNTVSNLSSTMALRDVTRSHGGEHYAAAVGEVNVVEMMKRSNAVIGGEGNGGVIVPELHYGRDALVGIALLLSTLAVDKLKLSEYRAKFPNYIMSKNKIDLSSSLDVDQLLAALAERYKDFETDETDGLKIYIRKGWVHLRKSNTEPIVRLYAEEKTKEALTEITKEIQAAVSSILNV